MAAENLEELIKRNRFHIVEREVEILRRFFQSYPEQISDVMREMNARKATSLGDYEFEEDDDWRDIATGDVTTLSLPFLTFLDDNLDALAALPAGLGVLVVGKMVRGSQMCFAHQKFQDFFECLAAFCRSDNGYSIEGKRDVLMAASDPVGPSYRDFVTMVVNLYAGWQEMLHDGTQIAAIGVRHLQELAPQYRIPIPDRTGSLHSTMPDVERIMAGHIDRRGYYDLHKVGDIFLTCIDGMKKLPYPPEDVDRFLTRSIQKRKLQNPEDMRKMFNEFFALLEGERGKEKSAHRTVDEAAECANLNRELAGSGYTVQRKLSSSTFKEVYAARDRYGTELVLKRIVDEKVRRVLAERGGTTDEMVRKEVKSSPFRMLHEHVSPAVPLFLPDGEVCILEKRYDMTLDEFFRKMCAGGGVFGRKPETGLKMVDKNDDKWRSRLGEDRWVEIWSEYGFESGKKPPYTIESGVLTRGSEYVLLEPYLSEILRLAHQVAQAMEYCHKNGIIHGDIKLDNIGVLSEKTGRYTTQKGALISDFGMATTDLPLVGDEERGGGLGRVYTKAPELFREGSHPSKATDAWSFGATLFYLFTGRYPFSDGICDYNSQVESRRYRWKLHRMFREGTVEKKLKSAIEQYVPQAIEIWPSDRDISLRKLIEFPNERPKVYSIFDVGRSLMGIFETCFEIGRPPGLTRNNIFDYFGLPFEDIRKNIEALQGMIKYNQEKRYEGMPMP